MVLIFSYCLKRQLMAWVVAGRLAGGKIHTFAQGTADGSQLSAGDFAGRVAAAPQVLANQFSRDLGPVKYAKAETPIGIEPLAFASILAEKEAS